MQRKDANVGAKSNPSMPEVKILDFKGLYTYPNQFGDSPAGALAAVQNAVLDEVGQVDLRRGRVQYSTTAFTSAVQGLTFDTINDKTIIHCSDDKLYVDNGSGTFTALSGTYTVPDTSNVESRVRTQNVNNNLYLTTGSGVYKVQSSSSTPIPAGAPIGLGGSGTTTGASGFQANNTQVAYRIVWLYIDLNKNLVQGAPSDRIIVSNSTGGTRDVSLTFLVPTTVDTTWTYRVYRSNQSATSTTEPDDNLQLVYSGTPSAGQITARTITITDNTPDSLRGETLYTTTQGIQNANYAPPAAVDLALFKGSMFYGNCTQKQTYFSTLISGSLLQNGDTISFYRGVTLLFTITGAAAENTATGTFLVATGGSSAQNITNTANSIVKVVNLYASNTAINAFYSSGYSESPGKMTFIDRGFNATAFSVVCSRTGNVFSPTLPSSGSTTTNTSDNADNPHYLYFSKSQQPEAVPLTNYIAIGSSAYPIIRILPTRDALIVIKTDGWYKVYGTDTSNFAAASIDVQLRIASVNSAVVLNNQIYAVTEQGVVSVSEQGAVQILSIPIHRDILELTTSNYPGFKGASWGLAYPSDQKYYFFTIDSETDTTATKAFTYNYITQNWSIENKAFTAGYVNPVDGKMYLSKYDAAGTDIYVERKTLTDFDYADEQYAVNIVSFTGKDVTLTSASSVAVGMTLGQGSQYSLVTAVVGNIVTVTDTITWTIGAAYAYQPINFSFTTSPIFAEDPTVMKQFPEISFVTKATSLANIQVSFLTDLQNQATAVPTLAPATGSAYGVGAFGYGVYGGSSPSAYLRTRMYVPQATQKGNWLSITFTVSEAFKRVKFSALQVVARKISVRMR